MMAQHVGRSRKSPAFLLIILFIINSTTIIDSSALPRINGDNTKPVINSVKLITSDYYHDILVNNKSNSNTIIKSDSYSYSSSVVAGNGESDQDAGDKYYLLTTGVNLNKLKHIKWTPDKTYCDININNNSGNINNYGINIWSNSEGTSAIFQFYNILEVTRIYLCQLDTNFQGDELLQRKWRPVEDLLVHLSRRKRDLPSVGQPLIPANGDAEKLHIYGLRLEGEQEEQEFANGVPKVVGETLVTIRIFGSGITTDTVISFTDIPQNRGEICDKIKSQEFIVEKVDNFTAIISGMLPLGSPFYICAKSMSSGSVNLFYHQGTEVYKQIISYQKTLPLWLQIIVILTCLSFSALFSGLNLGLMSMDRTELKILCNTGTEKEREYARTIQPVRNYGNYLLCSILFSNVLVNSIFTILLDDLTSGTVTVIGATLAIVIFGEISPQAFCSRHGLCVGAKTILITKITMVITYPLSYPISKFLDYMLGEEIGNVYNRERLKELVKVTTGYNDLEKDEYDLKLYFMFSFVKDVVNTRKVLHKFNYIHVVYKITYNYLSGHKGHMAFVQRVNNEGEGDPFYEVIGLITLEDVIEELIQAEIMDETDVFTDNRSKRKRLNNRPKLPDFTVFAEKKESQRIHISPQLTLAMFQYLSTTVAPFKPDTISETILRRLLKQDIIHHIKVKSREKARNDPAALIYQQGKSVDYFVLILEGRVEVTVGKENLTFESGPFTYFGCQALGTNIGVVESPTTNVNPQALGSIQSINLDAILRHTFVPDYSVRAVTEVFYLKVKRSLYLAAKRATLLERSQKDPSPSNDQFDDEVEKLLHSLDEDDRSMQSSPILSRKDDDMKSPEQNSPIRSATAPTSPTPVSASPVTNSKFLPQSKTSEPNGQLRNSPNKIEEPVEPSTNNSESHSKLNLDAEIASRLLSKKTNEDNNDELTNLLSTQDRS
ncbi:Similar to Cnnm2: Metal transporter CNNM2 (Mus musculus) [Cotesia congregata]|uniref:Similar to Cnnm2: Metal transporter CNNM2 (Mus musculus) n=1 Tax=Cotesia congregata TaxID=51543 RepID=A0A8J2E7H5_COTCN|nr:Similar to Cnnm2: Metal transporter CNNM2 (Mus musculus) [Cotesia congregata]